MTNEELRKRRAIVDNGPLDELAFGGAGAYGGVHGGEALAKFMLKNPRAQMRKLGAGQIADFTRWAKTRPDTGVVDKWLRFQHGPTPGELRKAKIGGGVLGTIAMLALENALDDEP